MHDIRYTSTRSADPKNSILIVKINLFFYLNKRKLIPSLMKKQNNSFRIPIRRNSIAKIEYHFADEAPERPLSKALFVTVLHR